MVGLRIFPEAATSVQTSSLSAVVGIAQTTFLAGLALMFIDSLVAGLTSAWRWSPACGRPREDPA
jgi:hypothetical protein